MRNFLTISISILFYVLPAQAQFLFDFNASLPVKVGGVALQNPWSGGLNNAQFSDFDFDFDGDMDLFVFDRSSDNIRVFTQEGTGPSTHYELAYGAKASFPSDLRYRVTMVDYDNDGRKDIFTYGIGGLKVYRNVGSLATGLQWELITDLLYTEYLGTYTNLYVSSSDIPAIIDVDGDGDIDVLTFHIGGQHMEYYQNQSMDLYGIPDSLIFELKNQCWGKFKEDFSTSAIMLNDPDAPCEGGSIPDPQKSGGHSGSTVLAIDIDNSGVMDLVIGDVSYPNLHLLINGGTAPNTDSPMISVDNAFPSNTTPANMTLFPASFFVDVDFDGVKDLLVGANAKNVSQNVNSVLFYKNIGSNALPNFIFIQDDFLQSEMIETGTGSVPVITDINEDGLDDMIVANFFRYDAAVDKQSVFSYYQNTGTAAAPEFTFIDDNYLDLTLQNYGLRSIPTFGDVDGDGDKDMFIGREDGTLIFYENFSTGSGSVFTTGSINYQDNLAQVISSSGFCSPQLFDLNNDGLLDLIIGKKSGDLMYYENIGTSLTPSFELTNPILGNVNTANGSPDGYSTPSFIRLGSATHLFCGDLDGRTHYFSDIDGNLGTGASFVLESDNHQGISTQGYSAFSLADLNNDGKLEIYAGQDLGGIFRFEHDSSSTSALNELLPEIDVVIYPNPTNGMITVSVEKGQAKNIVLYNLAGKELLTIIPNQNKEQIDLNNLPAGVYLIRVVLENDTQLTKRIVKN
jgi:hypothetical protein